MLASELREKSIPELRTQLHELLHEQFNLRMLLGSGQQVRTHMLKQLRRDIARVNTVIRAKETEGKS